MSYLHEAIFIMASQSILLISLHLQNLLMANKTSQHILNTSANLLGFCLFVITSLHITNRTESSILDELTSIVALLLTIACLLSFISLRTKSPAREKLFELTADYIFVGSLTGILIIIMLITLHFIR